MIPLLLEHIQPIVRPHPGPRPALPGKTIVVFYSFNVCIIVFVQMICTIPCFGFEILPFHF